MYQSVKNHWLSALGDGDDALLPWGNWRFPMRVHCFHLALLLAIATGAYGQSSSSKYTTDWLKSYGKYVEIAGATRAGAEVCATCHAEDTRWLTKITFQTETLPNTQKT